MAQCILYWDENLTGEPLVLGATTASLKNFNGPLPGQNWNDETSSIKIISGTWRFFEHVDFQGKSKELGPGEYLSTTSVGIEDNTISSVELVKE